MKLYGFVAEVMKTAEGFRRYWDAKHEEDPVRFPAEMSEAEWDDQFTAYCETVLPPYPDA